MPPTPWAMDEQILQAMRAFGAPAHEIERAAQLIEDKAHASEQANFEIHHDNLRSVRAWQRISTQWQYAGMSGVRVGLNYAAVVAWVQLQIPRRWRRSVMSDLELMERAALQALQEIRAEEEGE